MEFPTLNAITKTNQSTRMNYSGNDREKSSFVQTDRLSYNNYKRSEQHYSLVGKG